jgi:hypothetical protein
MYITLDGKHRVFYLDVSKLAGFEIEKSRPGGRVYDEGKATFFFTTGQSLTISLPFEDLYKLRIQLNKLIIEQPQPTKTD